MGIFGGFLAKRKDAVAGKMSRIENKDLMEAICGGAMLVAHISGGASKAEIQRIEGLIAANDKLKHFGPQINETLAKFDQLLAAGIRLGKVKIMREIADVKSNPEEAEEVFCTMLEVADDEGIDDQEKTLLIETAQVLGLRPATYGLT